LHKLGKETYVCIPCASLATQINEEEKEEVDEAVVKTDIEGTTEQFKYIIHIY